MTMQEELKQLARECEDELLHHILPFWMELRDERGGFYGQVTHQLVLHPDAPKGVILHARILWAFSAAYLRTKDPQYLDAAKHAYKFICLAWDKENGGFYWTLSADCMPYETDKYAYCNAFCIYGLSLYAEASGEQEPLDLALKAMRCVESHFARENGYIEAYLRDWLPLENDHLSEHNLHAAKTMNTTLHLIEAYAELYRLTSDPQTGKALRALLTLMAERIYNPDRNRLEVFFDDDLFTLSDLHSYGHDIEASWLVDHACECLGDEKLTEELRGIDYKLAAHVYATAFCGGALYNECFMQKDDKIRVWWVQAEGVIGFLNAAKTAEMRGEPEAQKTYTDCAITLWAYIRDHQIDREVGGEWFAETGLDGMPIGETDMAGLWKCPYHNSRMCLEVMRRIDACS